MATYRILLDPGSHLEVERLQVDGEQARREVAKGEYRLRGRGKPVDEDRLERTLTRLLKTSEQEARAHSDPDLALAVYESLDISRRDASDRDLWTFLNSTVGWPYVAWRWAQNGKVAKRRVAGGLDRSALARLWWMAELVGGESLEKREKRLTTMLSKQDLAVALYERPRLLRRPGIAEHLLAAAADPKKDWTEQRYRRFAQIARGYFGSRITTEFTKQNMEDAIEHLSERALESDVKEG